MTKRYYLVSFVIPCLSLSKLSLVMAGTYSRGSGGAPPRCISGSAIFIYNSLKVPNIVVIIKA